MRLVCTDACCAINLIKGDAIELIAELHGIRLCMQGLVEDEIGKSFALIAKLAAQGKFSLVSGDDILSSEVGAVASRYNIGLGESECIVIGRKLNCNIASDDKRARSAARSELGENRVTGSVGLLRRALACGLVTQVDAFEIYQKMIAGGGFLPRLQLSDFEAA